MDKEKKEKKVSYKGLLSVARDYEKKEKTIRESHYTQKYKEQPKTLQEKLSDLEKDKKKEQSKSIYGAIKSILPNKKFLKKPESKIKSISPKAVLRTFEGGSLVREGRTGYFNDEYEKEIGWLN